MRRLTDCRSTGRAGGKEASRGLSIIAGVIGIGPPPACILPDHGEPQQESIFCGDNASGESHISSRNTIIGRHPFGGLRGAKEI